MKRLLALLAVGALMSTAPASEKPVVSFSGMIDADAWTDMSGNFFSNTEVDLGLTAAFTEAVQAHLYLTINSWYYSASSDLGTYGRIPAGTAIPADRWVDVRFDGADIEFTTPYGIFTVGDLVYQFGTFNYYFYKRLSMITPESFARGLKYSLSMGPVTQSFLGGVNDIGSSGGDFLGITAVELNTSQSVEAYYGIRGDVRAGINNGSVIFAGAEYRGSFAEVFDVKASAGYTAYPGFDMSATYALLLEPSFSVGSFSTAAAVYAFIDPDNVSTSPVDDDFFVYIEPGYSFTDMIAAGLPIEYHLADMDDANSASLWLVPTVYIYPAPGVEWWIWGQMVQPLETGAARGWGLGSEIIVNF